mgnify:CR=1 FL=1|tara:strand:- start:1174 stop:1641 length:468 start_codon:yes stop_codon:yes gene_type:complete
MAHVSNINISQNVWWVERDAILIAYYSSSTDSFTSPDAVKTVTLFYIQRPDKFLLAGETPARDGFSSGDIYLNVALDGSIQMPESTFFNQTPEIPEQFHEALVARVIGNGYERKVDTLPLASYFLQKYDAGVKLAKKYSYRGRDGSIIQPSPIDF